MIDETQASRPHRDHEVLQMVEREERPLAAGWMEELLGAPLPDEPRSTCDDCAMLPAEGERPASHHFSPDVKCCTYIPALPNFLVGRVLGDDRLAVGRARVMALVERRLGLSPVGLLPGRTESASRWTSFGRAGGLRCPYYVDGPRRNCSIWPQRNGVCQSFFCRHSRRGPGFWFRKATERLLHYTERQLALWCVLELDLGSEALALLLPHPDRLRDPEDDRRGWGRYAGRELELYRDCAALVEPLPWSRVAEIGGAETRVLQEVARAAFAALTSRALPSALVVAQLTVEELRSDVVRLSGVSPYDPLELPRRVFDLLSCFDGAPLDVVRQRLAAANLELDDALLRSLIDHEVLVDADRA